MPLAQFPCPVNNGIVRVHMEPFRHGQVILPCGQDLPAAHPRLIHLFFHVIINLDHAHPVHDEFQFVRRNLFLAKPCDHMVRDRVSRHFFKPEPFQEGAAPVVLPQPCQPLGVDTQHLLKASRAR